MSVNWKLLDPIGKIPVKTGNNFPASTLQEKILIAVGIFERRNFMNLLEVQKEKEKEKKNRKARKGLTSSKKCCCKRTYLSQLHIGTQKQNFLSPQYMMRVEYGMTDDKGSEGFQITST